ncbi:MAG: hypothetical protein MUF84_08930 [Anaerolineae bacterium]|nr:hypothetical protein [Anaerolineae bacterium]
MLGMYIHTHWGYNRPYSARRWTDADWEGYLEGLSRLGFDTVMIWPQIDTMPLVPTASDAAYLTTLEQATEIAHRRFGMKVILVLTANCMGNERAAGYQFHNRPYFVCEKKIDPENATEVAALISQRSNALQFVPHADAIAIIDSDPGGYIGSTNADFVDLCVKQLEAFRAINPRTEFIYWMLVGWETYCRFWEAQVREEDPDPSPWRYEDPSDFSETLALLQERMPEPWWVTGYTAAHEQALLRLGLRDRAMYYPYGTIEGEPVFPLTVCYGGIERRLTPETLSRYPRGVMGNAQTHCLQLPHTYWFAHLAQGGTMATADLAGFAERLLPGLGRLIAESWEAIEPGDPEAQMQAAQALRSSLGSPHRLGDLGGLLFGSADRFLVDLAMNLELRAALGAFGQSVEGGRDVRPSLAGALAHFIAYQQRVGFVDAYDGPLTALLNAPLSRLNDPRLNAVLRDFSDWRSPAVRNGIVLRLTAAIEQFLLSRPAETGLPS